MVRLAGFMCFLLQFHSVCVAIVADYAWSKRNKLEQSLVCVCPTGLVGSSSKVWHHRMLVCPHTVYFSLVLCAWHLCVLWAGLCTCSLVRLRHANCVSEKVKSDEVLSSLLHGRYSARAICRKVKSVRTGNMICLYDEGRLQLPV